MKNAKTGIMFLLVASLFFTGCSKEAFDNFGASKEIITNGKWSIDYYFNGQDNTDTFQGFQFTFNSNGNLTASNGAESYTGTWTSIRGTDHGEILTLNFENTNAALQQLETDWNVGATSLNSIAMKNAANVQLRFHKF